MTSVDTFKSAVIRIRDILRGPGVSITGMDSMRHICLYLLSRYMTRAKVASLEVPLEFAWENLIETAQTKNGGVQKALDSFFHSEEDCLVRHFDRLFGTDKFSFDINNPQKHKEILEILNGVIMEDVDCQMDILGWVYEQHLKTGSSAARDLGQFFTDRFICEYMTELCKPGFKSAGVPESVCDPTMGTGGFLTAFVKSYKKHHVDKPIDWAVQQKEIHGCDTDPKVAGVARLNLFMETGGYRSTNLLTKDSLYGDLTQTQYNVILANMPFGIKGIKHAECCERVNKLKIRGTKSEPLFLQLMMVSLALGGRCAVVVPDGMLVNSSSCHNDTRKYLLDHFELKRVIKMNGQYFMNTSIKPSILFFENTGKPTTAVEFWEVLRNEKGEIAETMHVSVPREKLDASVSFDVRRYMESDTPVANPAGFPLVKLGDVCNFKYGFPFPSSGFKDKGDLAVTRSQNIQDGIVVSLEKQSYINNSNSYSEYILKVGDILISMDFDCGRTGIVVSSGFALNQRICKITSINEITLNNKFLYYSLRLGDFNRQMKLRHTGTTIKHIGGKDIENGIILLPPLQIQQEIVQTLDRIYNPGTTDLADTLKLTSQAMDLVLANPGGATLEPIVEAQRMIRKSAQMVADVKAQMVADVKAQMVAIMKSVGSRGFETKKLDDCVTMKRGNLVDADKDPSKNIYPYYAGKRITGYAPTYAFEGDNFMFNYRVNTKGDAYRLCQFVTGKYNCSRFSYVLSNKDNAVTNIKYLYYYVDNYNCIGMSTGTSIPEINTKNLKQINIVIPPLDFQLSAVSRMESLESQIKALESLQSQSEDNARFILDSYLAKKEPVDAVENSAADDTSEDTISHE
jgi:restriction endonuclease S subunit